MRKFTLLKLSVKMFHSKIMFLMDDNGPHDNIALFNLKFTQALMTPVFASKSEGFILKT